LASEPWIRLDDVADLEVTRSAAPGTGSLHSQLRAEKVRRVEHALRQAQGNCAEASRLLGMTRGNFSRLLRSLGIDPRRYRSE
jgi:transcriptional regulator with GAF, ATPase, and Fis domain